MPKQTKLILGILVIGFIIVGSLFLALKRPDVNLLANINIGVPAVY